MSGNNKIDDKILEIKSEFDNIELNNEQYIQQKLQIPDVSNIYERNIKPVPTVKKESDNTKKSVKGESTISLWQIINAKFTSLFNPR